MSLRKILAEEGLVRKAALFARPLVVELENMLDRIQGFRGRGEFNHYSKELDRAIEREDVESLKAIGDSMAWDLKSDFSFEDDWDDFLEKWKRTKRRF